jgi:hypothetical protein
MPRPPRDPYTRHCGKYYRFSYTRGNQTRYLCTRYLNDGVWTAKLSNERCGGTLIVITRGDGEEDMVYLEEDHVCTNENEGKASGPTTVIVHEPDNRPPLTITNRCLPYYGYPQLRRAPREAPCERPVSFPVNDFSYHVYLPTLKR